MAHSDNCATFADEFRKHLCSENYKRKHETMVIVRIMAIIVLGIATTYFAKKFIESIYNFIALGKKNYADVTRQKHGIVFNKKTNKLEADQSLIVPF